MRVTSWLLVAAVVLVARPAWPCLFVVPGLDGATFPFEGRTLPANGVLRAYGTFFDLGDPVSFVTADGVTTIPAIVERDEFSTILIPETPLGPGPWRLTIDTTDRRPEELPREVSFTLGLDEDLDAPAPPIVTATNHLRGELFPDVDCGSDLHDVIVIEASTGDDAASGIVVGNRNAAVDANGFASVSIFSDDGGTQTFNVVLRDFADNESPPTTVEVWTGCAGACASGDPALPLALVGLAFLRRRRPAR